MERTLHGEFIRTYQVEGKVQVVVDRDFGGRVTITLDAMEARDLGTTLIVQAATADKVRTRKDDDYSHDHYSPEREANVGVGRTAQGFPRD